MDDHRHDRVFAAMGSLPHLWQTALSYADVLQENPKEIALAMGIAPDDVPLP